MRAHTIVILIACYLVIVTDNPLHATSYQPDCNFQAVIDLNKNMDAPSKEDILLFYLSLGQEDCKNNVEFDEFSNEVLLDLFYQHTEMAIRSLSQENVDLDTIVMELNNPVSDKYASKDIYQKIEETPSSLGIIKTQLLEKLKVH